ncbi:proline-rich receptor-like protein kinase PERK9, partial [Pollicipes pollicipes]|uniref:proline-rich receptor-like protein kinase PERK9 n=1 Tax=Pollicipes pollicipes TaxID=41117 RepID=UPI00188541F4
QRPQPRPHLSPPQPPQPRPHLSPPQPPAPAPQRPQPRPHLSPLQPPQPRPHVSPPQRPQSRPHLSPQPPQPRPHVSPPQRPQPLPTGGTSTQGAVNAGVKSSSASSGDGAHASNITSSSQVINTPTGQTSKTSTSGAGATSGSAGTSGQAGANAAGTFKTDLRLPEFPGFPSSKKEGATRSHSNIHVSGSNSSLFEINQSANNTLVLPPPL